MTVGQSGETRTPGIPERNGSTMLERDDSIVYNAISSARQQKWQ